MPNAKDKYDVKDDADTLQMILISEIAGGKNGCRIIK